jgi:hypothetical protein
VLVSASDFGVKIRSILEVGRRDETEAPWLLLLEILQLLHRQEEFEEASIDYCVTFEVSPPAFVLSKSRVTTITDESLDQMVPANVFMMPTLVDSKTNLIDAITQFAKLHNPAIIDCSQLARVDFSAASQLLSGLAQRQSACGSTVQRDGTSRSRPHTPAQAIKNRAPEQRRRVTL